MSKRDLLLKVLLPLLIVIGGIVVSVLLIKGRPAPPRQETAFQGTLVETVKVAAADHRVAVTATGTVQPRFEAEIVPQVNGRVSQVAPQLAAGGFFRTGELLFALEAVDFELAVEKAATGLSKATLDLELVKAQAQIARDEWQRLHPGEEPNPLVVYLPQLRSAEAAVAGAHAALRQAELDLQRTRLTAPFNGFVRNEQVDLGQYLKSGTKVAMLTGTDQAEIIIALPLEDLQWLEVPRQPGQKGAPATVTLQAGAQQWQWPGWIDRSLGEVDPRGRMVRVAVIVADPYGLKNGAEKRPELAIGSFVEVTLQGSSLPQVIELPRRALRENDTVWVMAGDNRLQIVPVKVVRREEQTVVVSSGLHGGEEVVLTALTGAANGMLLRRTEP